MGKKSTPAPPDLTPYTDALKESGARADANSQAQLAWAKEQDAMNREILNKTLDIQLPIMQQQFENAQKDRARYEDVFQPLENNLVNEFQNFDTADRRDLARGQAIGDVNSQFDATRRNALQRLEGFGVDPSQTRNAALDLGVRTQQAAAQAAAATAATQRTQDTGRALRADAINIGKGLPSQVAGAYGQSIAAGQAGVGGANATSATSGQNMGNPTSWAQIGQAGAGGAGNMANSGFQNQMQQYNAQQAANASTMNAFGGLAGGALSFFRDGGKVRRRSALQYSVGGPVDVGLSDGSGVDDQVPANLSVGEFVVPADVVHKKGLEFFEKLVERYHTPASQQRATAGA